MKEIGESKERYDRIIWFALVYKDFFFESEGKI